MKKTEVEIGKTYMAKVSKKLVKVKVVGINITGRGWQAISQSTGRTIHIRGAQRLRPMKGTHVRKTENVDTAQKSVS